MQGGLEYIVRDDAVKIKKRKTDQSNEILREMRVDIDEEDCFCVSLYCDEILVIF